MQEKPVPQSHAVQDPAKIAKAAALSDLFHLRGGLVYCTHTHTSFQACGEDCIRF